MYAKSEVLGNCMWSKAALTSLTLPNTPYIYLPNTIYTSLLLYNMFQIEGIMFTEAVASIPRRRKATEAVKCVTCGAVKIDYCLLPFQWVFV